MLKKFRQMIKETSINVGKGSITTKVERKGTSRHHAMHRREPHIADPLRTAPSGQYDRPVKKTSLKVEEVPAMSVASGAVPSITDPTTNYAAQLKKKMMRRKKP
jgi:hypothetical protein